MPERQETEKTSSLECCAVPLPEKDFRLGATTVSWWSPNPGDAIIMSSGGTCDDRTLAEQVVKIALAAHGFQRVAFSVDGSMEKASSWEEIMSKAKRLIDSGNVTILRNGYNNIVAHVVGDHGEYNVEIGRDDPNARAITTWQCECPWDQYAWGRTRQWKKYEGRPCSHVMAAYWSSFASPLDQEYDPNTGQPMPHPSTTPGQKMGPEQGQLPFSDGPMSDMPPAPDQQTSFDPQGDQMALPGMGPDGMQQPPTPGTQAPMAPPGAPGVLPPAPMDQMQMMMQPPPPPGTTPAGAPGPPNSVSVPGARIPTPFGPVQYPGGTYSKTAAGETFSPPEIVRLLEPVYAMKEGREGATDAGQYTEIPAGSVGEVLGQDETTGWVEVIFPLDGGPMTSYHARAFVDAKDLKKTRMRNQSPWFGRK